MPAADWPDSLPDSFYEGLGQLNHREYYACHETLEALWIPESGSVRQIYQGVLQIAVGCFHLTVRANRRGAVNKLEAGARRLERAGLHTPPSAPIPIGPYGVDWTGLIQEADRLQAHLLTLGPDHIHTYDRALLPIVSYRRPPL